MSRRIAIGKMPNGSYRFRASRPGYDALTAADDMRYISFDSAWDDFVDIHLVGNATMNSSHAVTRLQVNFAALGYKPFVELRQRSGTTTWDNYITIRDFGGNHKRWLSGYDCQINTSNFRVLADYTSTIQEPSLPDTEYYALSFSYVIYRCGIPE